ncbi:2,5-dihydroxypyridine 5,6-dioxygenase [Arboricoccus pini]|uniref:2,5-dihydroxypyridine 5,6-dioxygenase n=1 Tax=Arboricoccus pini TaxID=1963835 RepID=A0A212RJ60_9PROT|nr:2,5-dihydroxypyridine 5,6-dioxygenase [Arboricoccus pini]SNB72360.1 2,5-dihydroxypyridine 5,6-dioxygenase [Arboricoccus pini]
MAISDYEMIQAWRQVLSLSNLKSGETVTILTNVLTNPQTLQTATIAARDMGAIVNRLDLPPMNGEKSLSRDALAYVGTTPLTGNKAAMALLKESDLVLDLMLLLFSPEQGEILESGTRMLLAVEPPEVLARMVPTEADRSRVLAASAKLQKAKEMHVVSKGGTNVRFKLGQYPMLEEYGFVDKPGRWDHWPSGFLATWPVEGQSNGTIVIDKGDILLPQKNYVNEPIILHVEDGFVKKMEGGIDTELLRDFIETYEDPEAYAISHIGWGLQDRARWSVLGLYDREATIGMDARAFAGNFLFSLGPNTEAGGNRNTACHIDIPLRNCTVMLDGQEVVHQGKVVNEVVA